jgi:hypothetical protein
MGAAVKHRRAWAAVAATAAVVSGALLVSSAVAGGERAGEIVIAHGSDRLPNHTASDWVTYADHVVVVTATAEKELPANEEEVEVGQGYIPREVNLQVKDTVWSRADAAKPAPAPAFAWPAAGWTFTQDGGRTPMALEGQPRIEVGHSYLMALAWQPASTDESGQTIPGEWRGLGENSVIPYDSGVIGKGESQGSEQATAKAEHADEGPDGPSIEQQMTGKSAADLAATLKTAQPVERQDFGPTR